MAICLAVMAGAMTACSDSDDGPSINGTGISGESWVGLSNVDMSNDGETRKFTFTAQDAWNASSNESWCKVSPARGRDGKSEITITSEPNTTDKTRTATVTINVSGASKKVQLTIRQKVEGSSTDPGTNEVLSWIYQYMNKYYLWNDPIPELKLNWSLNYQKFLTSILDGVADQGDLNHDDGHWKDGKRQYYYSFIDSEAPARSVGEEETGSGVMYMAATYYGNNTTVVLNIQQVAPGTPAYQAGLRRGAILTKVAGTTITANNYQNLASRVVQGNVTVTVAELANDGSIASTSDIQFGSATFVDPAIYNLSVLTLTNGKKVGCITYMGFDKQYDSALIQAFKDLKDQGVSDLILDLRYNGGGHVLSSVVLATLISGDAQKGKVYNRTTYNATRTAQGEVGVYKLGTSANPESAIGYDKITEALGASLNLNTVYVLCTENTASANELIINGLRGVDMTVNLIGTTTNGKNVGMEAMTKKIGNYSYTFAPITFYSENAKGFKDYSNGFTPDVELDEEDYMYGDFGSTKDCLTAAALQWISTGTKPSYSKSRAGNYVRRLKGDANNGRTPARNFGAIAMPEHIEL